MSLHDIVTKGSTDRSVTVTILDSTAGTPETGVVWNTSGIDLWYRREGAAKTSITEATLAALTTAHTDGGFLHVGDGVYRLDLPDAAFATGAEYVDFGGTVTGMVVIGGRVRLVDVDLEDSVRGGMTALPNAAADAAGGLVISDAGGLDMDAKLAATNEVTAARMGALTDWINGGRLDLLLDAIKVVTDALPDGGALTAIGTDTARLTAARAQVLDDWINAGRLDLILDAINASTAGLGGAAMRGTDNAALATKLKAYVQLLVRKDAAIATDLAVELGEVNADEGSGAGTYDNQVNSLEADSDAAFDPTVDEVDVGKINGATVTGDGTVGTEWGP